MNTSNILIGQYIGGDSLLHELDARSKLISVFVLTVVLFITTSFLSLFIVTLAILAFLFISQIPFRLMAKSLRPVVPVLFILFALQAFVVRTGEVLVTFGPVALYTGGIITAGVFIWRILALIVLTTLLTLTTRPLDLTDGIERLASPLKKVRVPVSEMALMMSLTLRFIPTLLRETETISKAQAARGVDVSSGPLNRRIKAFVPMLVPLFVRAFKRAEDLALAMESRGYRSGEQRTKWREMRWDKRDSIALMTVGVLACAIVWT
ncbi:energy-coupling factor transporter transmembrane component T family protein [Shouchella shacheensis]|uniref:energy-coupling factor transporter transmembrane component T family protein n=1 Tax=Shouchella shacheensis TaxID=1649580 RepID=UPI00073FE880|nr:energy-coupling factor transporter transmembrane component T [Shouchella shacheensis]